MRIAITARHVEIDDSLRAHTRELIEKVAKLIRRPSGAQIVFSEDHGAAAVEIELTAPRARVYIAKSVASDHRSALDEAMGRLKRQLSDEKEPPRRRARRSRVSHSQ